MTASLHLRRFSRVALGVAAVSLVAGLAPTASAAPRERPVVGECFDVTGSALEDMSLDAAPVDCAQPHTLETYHVTQWTFGNPYEIEEAALYEGADKVCTNGRPERYLGIPLARAPFSRAYWYFYFPTEEQWDQGENWVRCDVGLQRGWEGLQVVSGPMPDLIAEQGLRAWAWCTQSRPSKYDLQAPVPCAAATKPWILVTSTQLKGAKFPGFGQAKKQATAWCERIAKREGRVSRPSWYVWWSSEEEWKRDRAGFAWCYMNLAETRWR